MARIRTIKPEFPQSESMGRVSRDARLCFILLWTLADDSGRLRGNPKMLASLLYPYDDDAKRLIDKWLGELDGAACIRRYAIDGNFYIQIVGWLEHQKIEKPSASKIPPPQTVNESSGTFSNVLESSPPDQGVDQGVDQGRDQGDSAEDKASTPALLPLIAIPLIGDAEFGITEEMVREWSTAYPGVDVMQQLRQMRVWAQANPTKRKTHRGLASFVVRWLTKAQNEAGAIPNLRGRTTEPEWRTEQRQRTQLAAPGVAVGQSAGDFFDVEARNVTTPSLG
jgi:hypothetical protein